MIARNIEHVTIRLRPMLFGLVKFGTVPGGGGRKGRSKGLEELMLKESKSNMTGSSGHSEIDSS